MRRGSDTVPGVSVTGDMARIVHRVGTRVYPLGTKCRTVPPVRDLDQIERQFRTEVEAAERHLEVAMRLVRSMPPAQRAYALATELVMVLAAVSEAGRHLRSWSVRSIRDAERLSLAQLGQVIGVSKARAAKLAAVTDKEKQ